MLDGALVVGGLVLLYFGAEFLIAGAAGLARSYRIRPLIVGLTVVAYGTSAPELVVGLSASASDQGAIALGNVIGSNVANLGLILGITAAIAPAAVERVLLVREVPVLLVATALVPLVLLDGEMATWEAAGLVGLALGYSAWMITTARVGSVGDVGEMETDAELAGGLPLEAGRARMAVRAVVGLGLLIGGGHLLVEGAVGVARVFGMSERIIGLTIVAVGTSLPELATSLIAAVRGHGALAIGNVVGSNLFNILLVGGASGLVGRVGARLESVAVDLVALGAFTVFGAAAMVTGRRVSRVEGVVLVAGYLAFLVVLIRQSA